jgi:hypothetical protein
MTHRWLTRALVAVAVPALLVPVVASSATAAPKPPAVPTLAAVAKIYPHLEGGHADVTREKVYAAGKKCQQGKVIKGATGRDVLYMPKPAEEPDGLLPTGEEPVVFISTARFSSTKAARAFFAADRADTKKCLGTDGPLGPKAKMTLKKFRVGLGSESWGYQATWATKKATSSAALITVRKGARLIGVFSMALEGRTVPSIPKTIALARLALKTAR